MKERNLTNNDDQTCEDGWVTQWSGRMSSGMAAEVSFRNQGKNSTSILGQASAN